MTSFNEQCYKFLKQVPKGKVTTYKEVAKALNSKAYRAVGNAMTKNPYIPIIPCHRVVKSNGEVGGFVLGINKKIKLLRSEGIKILNNKINLDKYMFKTAV